MFGSLNSLIFKNNIFPENQNIYLKLQMSLRSMIIIF